MKSLQEKHKSNFSFCRSLTILEKLGYSPDRSLAGGWTINITHPPNKRNWASFIEALINIISIGRREQWLTFHVDGKGRPFYLFFPD